MEKDINDFLEFLQKKIKSLYWIQKNLNNYCRSIVSEIENTRLVISHVVKDMFNYDLINNYVSDELEKEKEINK